jgi:prepilin-type processing-associated H-X9-DG protein
MNIEKILGIVLAAAAVLSLMLAMLGRGAKSRGSRVALGVITSLWCLLTIGAGAMFQSKIGPLVLIEGLLLAIAPASGLLGGLAAGRGGSTARAALPAALILIVLDLGGFYALNHRVADLAETMGLFRPKAAAAVPEQNGCTENLKALYFAFDKYAESNGSLPTADKWMENEEIVSRVQKNEWFHCPQVSNQKDEKFGYAYNEALANLSLNGKKLSEMPNAAHTVLLYDSSDLQRSAHDKVSSLPLKGRHSGHNNVLYCDGHIEALAAGAAPGKAQ